MKSIKFFILYIFIFVFISYNQSLSSDKATIVKIKIYSMNWLARTQIRMTPELFLKESFTRDYEVIVTDKLYLNNVNDLLNNKKFENLCSQNVDVRSAFFIFYSNNQVDTLCFGKFHCFLLNNRAYKFDWELFELLASKIPFEDRYYIEFVKSIYFNY